ncbi:MAG: hypothetical protein PSX36_05465 [bacterium]|nr:hypothetical protein [bacterium]
MKNITIKWFTVSSMLMIFAFSFCTKDVAGPKGNPGTPGKKGNLLEVHTKIFLHPSSAWYKLEFDWESVIYVPEITKTVLESGEVKVYMQVGKEWYDLPYGEGLFYTRCWFEQGIVYLNYYNTHTAIPERPVSRNFRIVVLSPVQ